MVDSTVWGKAAIVGIGATDFSKKSGRSELRLAVEAIATALDDAGLSRADVDGMLTYSMDTNPETEVARNFGQDLKFLARMGTGGGGTGGIIQLAALGVVSGIAESVVVYRAFNERSGRRFGAGVVPETFDVATAESVAHAWSRSFGLVTAAGAAAMHARRYMHESGATSEDFGRVAVAARQHAATNPKAYFYQRPLTLDEHQASRWIVEPLHLFDCCQETDGAVAAVVTTLERARDLRNAPAVVYAASQGLAWDIETALASYNHDEGLPELELAGSQLWTMSGMTHDDIQAACFYDHFTPFVLEQLEALGFCGKGEARHFVADGNIELGGRLPINPHGGQIGEGYLHGLNGVLEAVRQIRGTAANQIPNVENVLVTGATLAPTSALIVGRDR
jgi:acetyl-CoA acetyltransferase